MEKIRIVETVQHQLWGKPVIQVTAYVYAPDDERMREGKDIAKEKLQSKRRKYVNQKVVTKVKERRG